MIKMKCHLIVLDKRNAFPYFNARYDHDKRLAEVIGRKFIRKGVKDRFHVDPDHIYQERGKFGINNKKMPLIIVDNATRKSVHPETFLPLKNDSDPEEIEGDPVEVGSSVKLHSDGEVDAMEENKLNFFIEKSFWQALMEKAKTPVLRLVIHLFCGVGLWHLLRVILISLGLAEGWI